MMDTSIAKVLLEGISTCLNDEERAILAKRMSEALLGAFLNGTDEKPDNLELLKLANRFACLAFLARRRQHANS